MIRPALRDQLERGQELVLAGLIACFGLWLIWLGGYLLAPLGGLVLAGAAALAVLALRRLRFRVPVSAPGIVQLDEGEISYLGPQTGGAVALVDLVEIRLITLHGRRLWRLKQADGQALLIPVDAAGADQLFDAFASLNGLSSADLLAAFAPRAPSAPQARVVMLGEDDRVVWRRS